MLLNQLLIDNSKTEKLQKLNSFTQGELAMYFKAFESLYSNNKISTLTGNSVTEILLWIKSVNFFAKASIFDRVLNTPLQPFTHSLTQSLSFIHLLTFLLYHYEIVYLLVADLRFISTKLVSVISNCNKTFFLYVKNNILIRNRCFKKWWLFHTAIVQHIQTFRSKAINRSMYSRMNQVKFVEGSL